MPSAIMFRMLPTSATNASKTLPPAITAFTQNSAPVGRRDEIHSSGGRMNVMGINPTLAIKPIKSSKKGTRIAMNVTTATNSVRTTSRSTTGLGRFDILERTAPSITSKSGMANT